MDAYGQRQLKWHYAKWHFPSGWYAHRCLILASIRSLCCNLYRCDASGKASTLKNGDIIQFGTESQAEVEVCMCSNDEHYRSHELDLDALRPVCCLQNSCTSYATSNNCSQVAMWLQITSVLSDNVTVQQYLEAQTHQQVQSIKVMARSFN